MMWNWIPFSFISHIHHYALFSLLSAPTQQCERQSLPYWLKLQASKETIKRICRLLKNINSETFLRIFQLLMRNWARYHNFRRIPCECVLLINLMNANLQRLLSKETNSKCTDCVIGWINRQGQFHQGNWLIKSWIWHSTAF